MSWLTKKSETPDLKDIQQASLKDRETIDQTVFEINENGRLIEKKLCTRGSRFEYRLEAVKDTLLTADLVFAVGGFIRVNYCNLQSLMGMGVTSAVGSILGSGIGYGIAQFSKASAQAKRKTMIIGFATGVATGSLFNKEMIDIGKKYQQNVTQNTQRLEPNPTDNYNQKLKQMIASGNTEVVHINAHKQPTTRLQYCD